MSKTAMLNKFDECGNYLFCKIMSKNPSNIYLHKFSNRNTRKRGEICSKLTIKTPERRQYVVLLFLLLTSNIFQTFF